MVDSGWIVKDAVVSIRLSGGFRYVTGQRIVPALSIGFAPQRNITQWPEAN